MIAGRGDTGSGCSAPGGTFNSDLVPIAHYEDGHDILWRDPAGQLAIWFQGDAAQAAYPGYDNQPAPVDLAWKVLGVGDVDGNLRSDILWRDSTHGLLQIWFDGNAFNGGDYPSYGNLPPNPMNFLNPSWIVEGVGDFDHDGRDDILWRESGGQLAIWLIEGARFVGDLYPQFVDTGWKIEGLLRPGSSSAARSVPEPQGLASLVLGIGLLAGLRRRQARRGDDESARVRNRLSPPASAGSPRRS